MSEWIALVGEPLSRMDCFDGMVNECIGVYKRHSETVNNCPTYLHVKNHDLMLWSTQDNLGWAFGPASLKGTSAAYIAVHDKAVEPANIKGTWMVWSKDLQLVGAPQLQLLHNQCSMDNGVVVVDECTREQRDAAGRKHAIDLNFETPRKRARPSACELEMRVAKARSACHAKIDAHARELGQRAMEDFWEDKIDANELDQRKKEARETATAEHTSLNQLDQAFAVFNEAVASRVKAEQQLDIAMGEVDTTVTAEEAAEKAVESLIRKLLPKAAESSDVVKTE
eukprot:CAMPEP_0119338844 /NCGR_PEP_ID=MMETSP1333-20130426/97025_1 /TAXON_ID=418940 /ORGANISM="Scyphosphaera apsteinii, Strain RCC1455" /LENGTH=282 /DNA_ID=CAMNT_0007350251 /DNA_START=41 /DNA_END=889 /DNA_ORIENTATION=-